MEVNVTNIIFPEGSIVRIDFTKNDSSILRIVSESIEDYIN
jgi:hypothetical protein